ncbi:LytTR family DNA-binding domain-containing protein [Dysgonomonas sp. HGC4]|uniref:LytTR family DNA-binding domain-containing protein n=1 Tax=Dysgonomonas sp. HGC4 TaxID=1658009 RepID=UPI000682490F|nr:LytTR family DNA-binding domain-containing protein [Dysgonomonas sp. HGC4]MBD8348798.1 LytTR family transcriptional regulator [Dysgonomonas sp. HGC4]
MSKHLVIVNSNELVRISPEKIVYISSDGNYSTMVLSNKQEKLFTFNLTSFQNIIEKQLQTNANDFIRIGKGLIINRKYIYYINPSKQQLVLFGENIINAFDLSASKEALRQLKEVIEESIQ